MKLKETFDRVASNKKVRIGIGAAAALLSLWFLFRPKPVISEIGKVSKGIYRQFVEEEGITRVKEKFTVYSPVNGVLKRIHKHAGADVKKGETLAVVRWDFDKAVVSPSNGKVLKILRESEGPVEMGTPLLEVGDTRQLEISAEILTQEAVRIHAGDPVEIEGWGGGTLNGKIRIVEPSAFTKISSLGVEEQRIRAIVDFDPPSEMGEGFRVRCKVTTMIRENALVAPTASLFRDGEDWYVFKVIKNKARKTKVILEDRSGENALIREGLNEGEEVILYPGEGIGDGVKVR
ncbi:efflux RND transporter periplasmic adaptor subunit [Leptospira ellisii]|uniref:Efflux RND transporter periplasmic adaptor subunit n=1 Tax=Leptospira ellisii TaxID=2023197 RepID=A0A2N0BBT1_9LEPT|nr:efflux RND transporter periplasmic adaptor subunit [Leptospira ellisii]MDV6237772.1 efflux RND transporter periplasmic adaptor subunit [Leptospira ellisii]PJZ93961.1 secretion protein HlyD [Leptospira ellisii]